MTKAERERILWLDPETGLPENLDRRGTRLKNLTNITEFADLLVAEDDGLNRRPPKELDSD